MLLAASSTGLHWLDVTVVIAYLIGVTAVGVWVGARFRGSVTSLCLAGSAKA